MPVWGENDVTGSKTKSTNAKKVRDDDDLQPQVRSSAATIIRRYENGSQYCRYKFNFLPTKLSPASSFFKKKLQNNTVPAKCTNAAAACNYNVHFPATKFCRSNF